MNKTQLLFLVILIEGYVVLACELLAIRQLIPFVGSGTETISIIISAVLLPLAIGYHSGGQAFRDSFQNIKSKNKKQLSVRKLLLKNILSALIILTFGLSYVFMEIFFGIMTAAGFDHRLIQTTLYCLLFLVTPVFLLGQTVPLISNYFSRRKLSEITGKMLFFSTAGSFLGSVFSTIVLMTFIGVHNTVIVTLGLLVFLCLLLVRKPMSYETLCSLFIFVIVFSLNNNSVMEQFHIVSNNAYNMVTIVKLPKEDAVVFSINRSASSKLAKDPDHYFDYWKYIQANFIGPISKPGNTPRDILILGAGGFTMGMFDKTNRYTYVDIDRSLKEVAEKYFLPEKISANKKFIAASARAFVRRDAKQYDLIILDLYTNVVSIPMEATTRDFLLDVKKRLKPNGAVVANIIMSPAFDDKFSLRYDNTFASVFPAYSRQIIGDFTAWPASKPQLNNVLYMYFNRPLAGDNTVYTDDKNSYSLDRD